MNIYTTAYQNGDINMTRSDCLKTTNKYDNINIINNTKHLNTKQEKSMDEISLVQYRIINLS